MSLSFPKVRVKNIFGDAQTLVCGGGKKEKKKGYRICDKVRLQHFPAVFVTAKEA